MPLRFRERLPMFLRGAADLILPPTCWICSELAAGREIALCGSCEQLLAQEEGPVCPVCGNRLAPATAAANVCPVCITHTFTFDGVVRLGAYTGALRDAVLRMKRP